MSDFAPHVVIRASWPPSRCLSIGPTPPTCCETFAFLLFLMLFIRRSLQCCGWRGRALSLLTDFPASSESQTWKQLPLPEPASPSARRQAGQTRPAITVAVQPQMHSQVCGAWRLKAANTFIWLCTLSFGLNSHQVPVPLPVVRPPRLLPPSVTFKKPWETNLAQEKRR